MLLGHAISNLPQTERRATLEAQLIWIAIAFASTLAAALIGDAHRIDGFAVVWPAAGIGVGLVLLGAPDKSRASYVGILAALAASSVFQGREAPVALALTSGTMVQVWLTTHLLQAAQSRERPPVRILETPLEVAVFLLATAVATGLAAIVISAGLAMAGRTGPLAPAGVAWIAAHGLGVLAVTPATLVLGMRGHRWRAIGWEDLGLAAAIAITAVLLVDNLATDTSLTSLLALSCVGPLLLWMALRGNTVRAAFAVLALVAGVLWQTGGTDGASEGTRIAQGVLALSAAALLLLGAWRESAVASLTFRKQPGGGDFRGLRAAAVLVPMSLFAAVAWWNWRNVEQEGRARVERMTLAIEQQARRLLEVQEATLDAVLSRVRGLTADQIARDETVHDFLSELDRLTPSTQALTLVRADNGRIVSSSISFPPPDVDLSHYDFLRTPRDGSSATYIGEVIRSIPSGTIAFTVSRSNPAQGLVAVTLVPVDQLHAFYSGLAESRSDAAGLARTDGAVLARLPSDGAPVGFRLPHNATIMRHLRGEVARLTTSRAAIDGVQRLFDFRQVGNYPVYALYGMDTSALRAAWLRRLGPFALLTLLAAMLLDALARRTEQATAAQRRAEIEAETAKVQALQAKALTDSQQRLRIALNGARLGWFERDLATGIGYWSPEQRALWGVGPEHERTTLADWLARVHPDDRARIEQLHAAPPTSDQRYELEYRILLPDGAARWLASRGERIAAADGSARVVGVTYDITSAKQQEQLLRDSEATFRAMFAISSVGKVQVDTVTGRFLRANAAYCAMTGYSEAELQGLTFSEITHPDDREADRDQIQRLAVGDIAAHDVEKRYVRKDGGIVWVRVTVNVIRDAAGRPWRNTAVIQDITARVQAEQALRASEDKYRSLFQSIDEGFCIVEMIMDDAGRPADYRFIEANAVFARQSGLENAIGRTARELVPTLEQSWIDTYGKVALTGESARFQHSSAPMGRWFDVYASRVGGPDSLRVAIVFNDITTRKQAEQALAASEARFRTMVTTAHQGIWEIDGEGRTSFVNPRLAELLATTPEAMLGRPVTDFVAPEDAAATGEHVKVNLAGVAEEFEARLRRADGTLVHALAATAPLLDVKGNVVGAIGGFLDLSDRKRAEERQRMLMRELAHRGKNLLAVIQSIANRTLSGGGPLAAAREAFTGRLQALSRTYGSLTDEVFEGAPLEELLRGELAPFGARAHVRGPRVMLTAKVAQTFTLIVHELATNAAKYGALSVPHGRLEVDWHVTGEGAERRFLFDWVEVGGPPAEKPTRLGFGSTLVSLVAGQELDCTPVLDYTETGFRYHFAAPLERIGAPVEDSPVRQRLSSATLRQLYDAWASASGPNGTLPQFSRFDRAGFQSSGELTVAEIVGGQARMIEVGERLGARLGSDAGQRTALDEPPDSLAQAYLRCAGEKVPCYERLRFDFGDGAPVVFERLLVPFSPGGRTVTHVVGLAVFSGETQPGSVRKTTETTDKL